MKLRKEYLRHWLKMDVSFFFLLSSFIPHYDQLVDRNDDTEGAWTMAGGEETTLRDKIDEALTTHFISGNRGKSHGWKEPTEEELLEELEEIEQEKEVQIDSLSLLKRSLTPSKMRSKMKKEEEIINEMEDMEEEDKDESEGEGIEEEETGKENEIDDVLGKILDRKDNVSSEKVEKVGKKLSSNDPFVQNFEMEITEKMVNDYLAQLPSYQPVEYFFDNLMLKNQLRLRLRSMKAWDVFLAPILAYLPCEHKYKILR